jgi:hypothetical protein
MGFRPLYSGSASDQVVDENDPLGIVEPEDRVGEHVAKNACIGFARGVRGGGQGALALG